MRNGVLFELQTQERDTRERGFSLLLTPTAVQAPYTSEGYSNLTEQLKMLPTPLTTDGKGYSAADLRRNSPAMRAAPSFDFDKFQPAIEKWEKVLGRKAPAPVKDGKLNALFSEFMMGVPEGWITDIDLPYTQKVKACGNGVVPQQAALALSILL